MANRRKRGLLSWVRRIACPRNFARHHGGASAVEFAMIGLPFIALIFVTLQVAIILMAQEELETAVESAGRLVLTNNAGSYTQALFTQKVCSYLPALFNCNNIMVNMQTATSFSTASTGAPALTFSGGKVTNTFSYQPGAPGDVVVLQVMYLWPVFGNLLGFNLVNESNGTHLLMATSVFQNEP